MKSSIKALVSMADDANKRVKANAHNQEMNDKKNHETKATQMAEDITTLKKKLTELVAEHKEKEQSLRKVRNIPACMNTLLQYHSLTTEK